MTSEDDDMDHSEAELHWEGVTPSAEIIAKVRADLRTSLPDLRRAEDLIFHAVFLSDDMDGPIVMLSGRAEGGFHAEYFPDPEWMSIEELEEELGE